MPGLRRLTGLAAGLRRGLSDPRAVGRLVRPTSAGTGRAPAVHRSAGPSRALGREVGAPDGARIRTRRIGAAAGAEVAVVSGTAAAASARSVEAIPHAFRHVLALGS